MTKRFGWTKNVLIHQIENQTFEKTVLGQQNFEENLPAELQAQAILAVKDDYAFGFLELGDQHSEYQLEQAILQNLAERVELVFPRSGGIGAAGRSGDCRRGAEVVV